MYRKILEFIFKPPFFERWNVQILKRLGVRFEGDYNSVRIAKCNILGGPYSNLIIGNSANIIDNAFILLRDVGVLCSSGTAYNEWTNGHPGTDG